MSRLQTLRERLFATWLDTAVTLICLYIVWRLSVPLVEWLLIDATWNGTSREDCKASGACWVFVRARFGQFMYGQYPVSERWRVDIVAVLMVLAALVLSWRRLPRRREVAAGCVIILPLIMPTGFDVDRLARAIIGLAFVIAAYMAEAVRGGLQALPEGQAEAAQALGLGYWRIQHKIVLPQALRIALPAMTNEFIALFKNTTLVLIVSIFDLLGIAQAALADPAWVGMNMEAYVFAGAIYWFACFGLSQWSRSREKRLQAAYGR